METDDQTTLARIAAKRRVMFVPVALELVEQLREHPDDFVGTIGWLDNEDSPGEGDLLFTRSSHG